MHKLPVAIVIPCYNERETIALFLKGLSSRLSNNDLIVVADDSHPDYRDDFIELCQSSIKNENIKLLFTFSDSKSGRGFAVRRAMELLQNLNHEIEFVIECDADSSHRIEDVILLARSESLSDVLIGSRYLPSSAIIGWPQSRKVFSKLINLMIPRLLGIDVSDTTNGLRRYNRSAVSKLLNFEIKNKGFIYLSEQILILSNSGFTFSELPTVFVNRTIGSSTVTWKEVRDSLFGLFNLVVNKRRYELGQI